MAKVVSLTVHRNTKTRREAKLTRTEMVANAKSMGGSDRIIAYAIVGIGASGEAYASWDTGKAAPMWGFPHLIADVLSTSMRTSGVPEDFEAS